MTKYVSVYRCRLCGVQYIEGGADLAILAVRGASGYDLEIIREEERKQ